MWLIVKNKKDWYFSSDMLYLWYNRCHGQDANLSSNHEIISSHIWEIDGINNKIYKSDGYIVPSN